LSPYFKVSEPFHSFLGNTFAVQVKQNWPQTAVTVKKVQKRKKPKNQKALMIEQGTCGVKTGQQSNIEPFAGTTVLNIVIDIPECVVQVVTSIIGDNLTLLFTELSNLTTVKIQENGTSRLKR
jgi:hypothetical protein